MKVVRVHAYNKNNIIAFFDIEIGGFVVKGFKLIKSFGNSYVAMPAQKGRDNRWYPQAFPVNQETKTELKHCIIDALQDIEENRLPVEQHREIGRETKKDLNVEEKIEISRRYLPTRWHWNPIDKIKQMRGAHFRDMRLRSQGKDD